MPIVETGFINKSPVLYLRRRRNLDITRSPGTYSMSTSRYPEHITSGRSVSDPWVPVDRGNVYPNHFPGTRFGSTEVVMSRDYDKEHPKWVKSIQLVIDGTCAPT